MRNAAEVFTSASEDWSDLDGSPFPVPRSIDELRRDPEFREQAEDAIVALVPFWSAAAA
jgi:antitoxin HicB